MTINDMSINVSKTKLVVFGKSSTVKYPIPDVHTNSQTIQRVTSLRILGVQFDEFMTWKEHLKILTNSEKKNKKRRN